jgi:hypothetical protein
MCVHGVWRQSGCGTSGGGSENLAKQKQGKVCAYVDGVFEVDEVDSEEEVVDEDAVVDDRVLEEVEEVSASVEDAVEEEEEDVDELSSSVDDSVIEEEVEGVVVEDEVSSPIAPAEERKKKKNDQNSKGEWKTSATEGADGSGRFKSAHE